MRSKSGMDRAMPRPNRGPDMKRLADEFVGLMGDLDWQLDYSEQSVRTLEEMIECQFADWRPWRRGQVAKKNLPIASLIGAYFGEVMIRQIGGEWGWMPEFEVAAVQHPVGNVDVTAREGAEAVGQWQRG